MSTEQEQRLLDHAFVNRVVEPGSLAAAQWLGVTDIGDAAAALREGRAPQVVQQRADPRLPDADPETDLAHAARLGARLVTPDSPEWPHLAFGALHLATARRLALLADGVRLEPRDGGEQTPPVALWVRGRADLSLAAMTTVALVGSRAATGYGEWVAADFAAKLADRSATVVSGGAYGIDGAAHRAALGSGGQTWLVSAAGIDHRYPTRNAGLYDAAAAEGLVITEYPPGARPLRHRFHLRNRLIAALSCCVVVVEAALRSGALNTARHALDLPRPLLAVPGPITSAMSAGCHQQLRGERSATPDVKAELCTGVDEIMAHVDGTLLERGPGVADPVRTSLDRLAPTARRVFDGLPRRGWADELTIAGRAGVSALDVARSLPSLALAGLVESSVDGHRVAPGVLP